MGDKLPATTSIITEGWWWPWETLAAHQYPSISRESPTSRPETCWAALPGHRQAHDQRL